MARVYISSTFQDLRDYREAVYRALRRLRHDVIAMEDYVAREDRPVAMCVKDVQECDLYVGILGFRYGYIPEVKNPDNKSITEMEFEAAGEEGITRLMFVGDKEGWGASKLDALSGDNQAGARIKGFRERVEKEHSPQRFNKPADLAAIVTASVAQWGKERQYTPNTVYTSEHFIEQWRGHRHRARLDRKQVDAGIELTLDICKRFAIRPAFCFASTTFDFPQCFGKATILCHSNCRKDKEDLILESWVWDKLEAAGMRVVK